MTETPFEKILDDEASQLYRSEFTDTAAEISMQLAIFENRLDELRRWVVGTVRAVDGHSHGPDGEVIVDNLTGDIPPWRDEPRST